MPTAGHGGASVPPPSLLRPSSVPAPSLLRPCSVPTAVKISVVTKLLLLAVLGACGAPGTDSVFSKGNPKVAQKGAVAGQVTPVPQPPPLRIETKRYNGLYRRNGEESRFQACGTTRPLDVFGPPEARIVLHERFRYGSVWPGMKLYAVFQGTIVTDTVKPVKPDSGPGTVRTRFFLTRVDSLRAWETGDCGGMRVN